MKILQMYLENVYCTSTIKMIILWWKYTLAFRLETGKIVMYFRLWNTYMHKHKQIKIIIAS